VAVYVDNRAGIAPEGLRRAQLEAADVFRDAGVDIEWSDGGLTESLIPPLAPGSPPRVVVMLIASTPSQLRGAAGCPLGMALPERSMAYVFARSIGAQSRTRPVDRDRMLGHVIAHEVGHLLLPEATHSRYGIMRATLDVAFTNPNRFTDREASAIRADLAARSRDR
jgi:hypothetical protein